jgi:hypothetical protein
VASGSLSAWRATRAAHFLKSGTSDILHSSDSGPFGKSRGMSFRFKEACDPNRGAAGMAGPDLSLLPAFWRRRRRKRGAAN